MANAAKRLRPQVVHESSVGESLGLPVRLVISPAGGRLRLLPPSRFHDGREWVTAGQVIALVENGAVTHEVHSPSDALVAGVLVREGEPVAPGQPLVWLDETAKPPRPGPEVAT